MGDLELGFEAFTSADDPEQTLWVSTVQPGSESEEGENVGELGAKGQGGPLNTAPRDKLNGSPPHGPRLSASWYVESRADGQG